MKLLVVATEPISAQHLRQAVGPNRLDDVEVMVVAPALHASALRFWVSDADAAIARAHEVERQSVDRLHAARVPAAGDVGEGDLAQAVRDALVSFEADRVLLFRHPPDAQRYGEEINADQLADELGIAVETFEVAPT